LLGRVALATLVKTLTLIGRTRSLTLLVALTTSLFESSAAEIELPPGVIVTSESKTHVHALISGLHTWDFPALVRIHALFTVYFDERGATDEKLKALSQIRFTPE